MKTAARGELRPLFENGLELAMKPLHGFTQLQ